MAWNEPGNGQDPWGSGGGRRGNNDSPPDIDELIKRLKARFGQGGGGKDGGKGRVPGGGSVAIIAGIIAALWLASGFYVIDEQQRGVVLRFGEHAGTTSPGLRWHIPWPVEAVEKVNLTQVRSVTDNASMLTQDENIVQLELKVQYRLTSAEDYLFNTRDPDGTLRQLTKSAVRDVVGSSTMDFVIKDGREAVADQTKEILQRALDEYGTGLILTEVNLQDAQPPEPVQGAFADAIKAREDQVRLKNEAEAYSNDRLPRARGEAAREIAQATAYRERRIAEANGDAARFTQLLGEYAQAPEVTRERMYLESMGEVLSNSSKVLVDVDSSNPLLYLPLDKLGGKRLGDPSQAGASSGYSPSARQSGANDANQSDNYRSRERGRR